MLISRLPPPLLGRFFIEGNFQNKHLKRIQEGHNGKSISADQQYLKLCSIADKEGRAFARTALEHFADRESSQMFLNSLFYNHSIMESDQFAVYLGLMYEFIGQEMPDDMDCYIVMDQESNNLF